MLLQKDIAVITIVFAHPDGSTADCRLEDAMAEVLSLFCTAVRRLKANGNTCELGRPPTSIP